MGMGTAGKAAATPRGWGQSTVTLWDGDRDHDNTEGVGRINICVNFTRITVILARRK